MFYGLSPASYSPTFEILSNAVDSMPTYSINPSTQIHPGTPLYTLLLSFAPLCPLDVYALAAHHKIHSLAVMASSHLLSYPLHTITDSQAIRIGAVYLKKLMALHIDRLNALKEVLLKPPYPHPPTRVCDFSAQKKLTRAWSLVSANLAWEASPGESCLVVSHLTRNVLMRCKIFRHVCAFDSCSIGPSHRSIRLRRLSKLSSRSPKRSSCAMDVCQCESRTRLFVLFVVPIHTLYIT